MRKWCRWAYGMATFFSIWAMPWFKAGEIGRAILAYERALKLMPGDEDVLSNLRFVNAHKEDKGPEEDVNLLTRMLSSANRVLSANVLAVLSSISLFLMSAAAVLWLYSTSSPFAVDRAAGAGRAWGCAVQAPC